MSPPEEASNAADAAVPLLEKPEAVQAAAEAVKALDPLHSDMGWGPVDSCTILIDSLHHVGNMPWWAAILAATTIFRLAVFPLNVRQARNSLRMRGLQPEMLHLKAAMEENPARTPEDQAKWAQQMSRLQQKHGVSLFGSLLGPLAQIPIFLTMFWTLRRMAEEYPSFEQGGALWFTNLAEVDATYGLPLLSSLTFLTMVELGTDAPQADAEKAERMKMVMRGMALVMFPVTATMPAAVALYWTWSNVLSVAQAGFLRIPPVKEALGIKLLVDPVAEPAAARRPSGEGKLFDKNPRTRMSRQMRRERRS